MATYDELVKLIKEVKPSTEMNVGGKVMKGERLKNYLISKLTHPNTIDLQAEQKEEAKAKGKAKKEISENQLKEE